MDLIGQIAGVLIFAAYVFYIVAIIRGQTKPSRATWFLLATITLVITLSYIDLGASTTLWAALADCAGTFIIAGLSIFYGTGGWNPVDKLCIATAIFCLVIYVLLSEYPLVTLVASLLMDGAAMIPTIYHAKSYPEEEDATAWMMTFIANILTIFAITSWNVDIALYPLYMLAINTVVVFLVFRKKIIVSIERLENLFSR